MERVDWERREMVYGVEQCVEEKHGYTQKALHKGARMVGKYK